jgi:hypothetical protein
VLCEFPRFSGSCIGKWYILMNLVVRRERKYSEVGSEYGDARASSFGRAEVL